MFSLTQRNAACFMKRRLLSSTTQHHPKIGVITRRSKPVSSTSSGAPKQRLKNVDQPEEFIMTPETHRNNFLLAVTLLCSSAAILVYSMKAVGQAASHDGGEDPLETLRKEAAAAQAKKDRESQELVDAQDMIQKVKSGAFDPDKYEDLEEETEAKKRSWWKFW